MSDDNPEIDHQMASLFDPNIQEGPPEAVKGHNGTRDEHDGDGVQGDPDAAAVIALTKQDFLVSFLVDARGGSMKGCRFSGVKVSTNVTHLKAKILG